MRPGPLCVWYGDWVNPGTTCISLSPAPIIVGVAEFVARETMEVVARKLEALRDDIDAALAYIASLPERIRRQAAYNFFASFFDHYLPKKLLRQYVWGQGGELVLTEQEMIDCNPYINVMNCKAFQEALKDAAGRNAPSKSDIDITCPAAALTNGTLGQFSVKMRGSFRLPRRRQLGVRRQDELLRHVGFRPEGFQHGRPKPPRRAQDPVRPSHAAR